MARLFSDEELAEMTVDNLEKLNSLIDAGEREQAKILAQKIVQNYEGLLFVVEDWINLLLRYIHDNMGIEKLEDALRLSGEFWFKPMYDRCNEIPFREMIVEWAEMMRSHSREGLKKIEEDDEKVQFVLDPCCSGGRMMRQYGKDLARVPVSHRVSFGVAGQVPIYCTHCSTQHGFLSVEWGGAPFPYVIPPKSDGDPCLHIFYKDPKNIPDEAYARHGVKRPE